jgi:cold shock CspA family protein
MAKAMIFIDGTWLYSNNSKLAESFHKNEFVLDYGKLPRILAQEVAAQMNTGEVDVVRTHLFGSYAVNFDARDEDVAQRRRDFFMMLKEKYHYEVELFPINFRGRRLLRNDRDQDDHFEPREKCGDIALASSMMYYAAVPGSYDVAITVVGDQDFKPVLQYARRLGKRTAIASIKNSCYPEYADPVDKARVRDFDIIWLDDHLDRLELKYERRLLRCESPLHSGARLIWTTYYPKKGEKFYCDKCRAEFAKQKAEEQQQYMNDYEREEFNGNSSQVRSNGGNNGGSNGGNNGGGTGEIFAGIVKTTFPDRGFGFIQSLDGKDYFFHLTDLENDLQFEDLVDGLPVDFEVKREPLHEKAGAAQHVRACEYADD